MARQKKRGVPVFDGANTEGILRDNGWVPDHATALYSNDGPYPKTPLQDNLLDPNGINSEGYPINLTRVGHYLERILELIPFAGKGVAKALKSPNAKKVVVAASAILIAYGLSNSGGPIATAAAEDTGSSYQSHVIPMEAYKNPSEVKALTVDSQKAPASTNGIPDLTTRDDVLISANDYNKLALGLEGLENASSHSELNLSAEYQQELKEHCLPSGMVILSNDQNAKYHHIDSFTIGIENAKEATVIYNGHVVYQGDVKNTAFELKADGVHTQEIERYGTDYKANDGVFTPGQSHKGSILVSFEENNSTSKKDYINGKEVVFFISKDAPLKMRDTRQGYFLMNEEVLGQPLKETLDDIADLYGDKDLSAFMPNIFA